jgi:hypothetical protein
VIYVVTGLAKLLPGGGEACDSKVSFDSIVPVELVESDEGLLDSVDYNYLKV